MIMVDHSQTSYDDDDDDYDYDGDDDDDDDDGQVGIYVSCLSQHWHLLTQAYVRSRSPPED